MKRFIFYCIAFLIVACGFGYFAYNYLDINSISDLWNRIQDNIKYKVALAIAFVYGLHCLINFIILSIKMNNRVSYTFYGRPIEFHGETVNGVDIGRITFRNKQNNELEGHHIYTRKSIELPSANTTFLISIGYNGTVKSMYELDETNKKCGSEMVVKQPVITSFLMTLLVSIFPIVSVIIVYKNCKEM